MAEFIPTYSFTEFKKLKASELKQLKSCEITSDGEYLFTFVNPSTDYIRVQTEYKSQLSNSVSTLKDLDQIIGVPSGSV